MIRKTSIWLNVSSLITWERNAVGIVRVESEFAKYLLSHKLYNPKFCIFNKVDRKYYEVENNVVEAAICRVSGRKDLVATPLPSGGSLKKRLKSYISNNLYKLPPIFIGPSKKSIRLIRSLYRELYLVPRYYWNLKNSQHSTYRGFANIKFMNLPVANFNRDDSFVSMGLDWDDNGFDALYKLKKSKGIKCILFCYDIIPVLFPHFYASDVDKRFAKYFVDLAWCADSVLCISNQSKNDLNALLIEANVPIPELRVVRLGDIKMDKKVSFSTKNIDAILKQPFILFVSTIERRKNHETIYKAYTRLVDQGKKDELPLMVFVGMSGWGVNDLMSDLRFDTRIKDKIFICNGISDDELMMLYEKCLFTIYPSLYEGWGLPVAESLVNGKFCICSNTSSLPEVGGDLVDYVDPWDLKEWVEKLYFYSTHRDVVAQNEQRIVSEYKPFLWSQFGSQVVEAIQLSDEI